MDLKTDKMIAEKDGSIGWVIFNNPPRRNAVSLEMWEGLGVILSDYQKDDGIRVVIMKGAGDRAFVSGADISEFDSKRGSSKAKADYGRSSAFGSRMLYRLDKPLIAMIQGYCLGGGMAIALNADIRIATDDARFGIPAARLGLGYEYEGVKALCDLVGPSHASDILLSARFLDAAEALHIGLVNRVVTRAELEPTVRDYAATIAGNAPLTVKAAKAAIKEAVKDSETRDLNRVRSLINACFNSKDYAEGRRAFAEKRKPAFRGE